MYMELFLLIILEKTLTNSNNIFCNWAQKLFKLYKFQTQPVNRPIYELVKFLLLQINCELETNEEKENGDRKMRTN